VDISTDGGETWSQITPVGGYAYKIYNNTASPFPPDTPCFAWTDDWTQVTFDLSAYEGRAKIRFVFGSDGYVGEEGWYIDDIDVSDDMASVRIDNEDLKMIPAVFALHGITPNPVSSAATVAFDVPHTSRVSIQVFDVTGRAVLTLADSIFEPGRYSRNLEMGNDLASGMYFIRMQAAQFAHTTKVILLK
jgi:hypothetical protein